MVMIVPYHTVGEEVLIRHCVSGSVCHGDAGIVIECSHCFMQGGRCNVGQDHGFSTLKQVSWIIISIIPLYCTALPKSSHIHAHRVYVRELILLILACICIRHEKLKRKNIYFILASKIKNSSGFALLMIIRN